MKNFCASYMVQSIIVFLIYITIFVCWINANIITFTTSKLYSGLTCCYSGLRFRFWEVGEFIFKSGEYQNLKILAGDKTAVNNRSWLGVWKWWHNLITFNGAVSILYAHFLKRLFYIMEKIFIHLFYKQQKHIIYQCEYMCILIYCKKTNPLQAFQKIRLRNLLEMHLLYQF